MLSPDEPLVFDTSTLREVRRWPTDGLRSLSLRGITCVVPTVVLAEYGRYRFAAAQRLGIEQLSLADIEAELADARVQVTPTDARVVAALLDWTLETFDTPEVYGHFKSRLAISSTSHFWWLVVQAKQWVEVGDPKAFAALCDEVKAVVPEFKLRKMAPTQVDWLVIGHAAAVSGWLATEEGGAEMGCYSKRCKAADLRSWLEEA